VTRNDDDDDDNNNNDDDDKKKKKKGIRGWDEVAVGTSPRGIDANIQPLYAQDRPCMMKSHILQEVTLFNILTEHCGSRGVNLEKKSPSLKCGLPC
jgi:hypothetical protein